MMKLDLMSRLVEGKYIEHIWNHMGEAGEKSHHRAQKLFHSKTMRNGGRDERNHVSEFSELLFGFVGICRVATEEKRIRSYDEISKICKNLFNLTEHSNKTYLDICRDIPREPKLVIGKDNPAGQQLRGVVFATAGRFSGNVTWGN